MTAPYTPTGLVPPSPSYTLPQDVVDLVVVETVNDPFVTAADNIAWILLLLAGSANIANYGATVGSSFDNTAIIQSALDAQQAAGGGIVLIPPGKFRITGTLNMPARVSLLGVPGGSSIIALDHASADMFSFASGYRGQITQVRLEANQANTGVVFHCTTGAHLLFLRGTINFAASLLQGKIFQGAGGAMFLALTDSDINVALVGTSPIVSDGTTIQGGSISLPAAAQNPICDGSIGYVRARDVTLIQSTPPLGGFAFFDGNSGSGELLLVEDCDFDVAAGGTLPTYAISVAGGLIQSSGNNFHSVEPCLFVAAAAPGSDIQLAPLVNLGTEAVAATVTMRDGYASGMIAYDTVIGTVEIVLPRILFLGQRFTAIKLNHSGSGQILAYAAQAPDLVNSVSTGSVSTGNFSSATFEAVEYSGDSYWVQVGEPRP